MRILLLVLMALAVLFLSAVAQSADGSNDKPATDTVEAACQSVVKSLAANDAAALRDQIADDFQLIDHEGKTDTKESILRAIAKGILKFGQFEMGRARTKEIGDAGVVQGLVRIELTYGQENPVALQDRFGLTAVFVKQDQKWRLTAAHLTKIKPAR